jgi:hypothetical protein
MPFTALHLGPGLLLKAAAPRHFSLVAFGATQVGIGATIALRRLLRRSRYASIPAVKGETSVFSALAGGDILGCAGIAAVIVFLRPGAWRPTPSA